MRTPLRSRLSQISTLQLLGLGALCIFCGLILLSALNVMVRTKPHGVQAEPVVAARQPGPAPAIVPVKVDPPRDPDATASIPAAPTAPAAAATVTERAPETASAPPARADVEPAGPATVQPLIGRPHRSARRAARRARGYAVNIGRDLRIVAAEREGRRSRWLITTASPLPPDDAAAMCAEFRRHRVPCE